MLGAERTAGVLFAGGGGVECGMFDAGIDPIWAVEWNPHNTQLSEALIQSHKRNFPNCKVVAKPVQQVDWRRLPKVNILWASPMCSNFSMAKNAEETLEDIEMAMAVCDAIAILTPTYFYLENVAGYRKSVSFDAIISTLKRLGYSVEWSIENFAHYGLPQARKRLILRSALGVAVSSLPKKVEKHVGWYEAIADLIPNLPDSELLPNQQQSADKYLEKNPPAPLLIDRVGGRGDYKAKPGHLPANTILRSQFTDGNNRNRNRCGDIRLLNGEIKSLTIECVRRLQGFPDWYQMPESVAIAGSILGYSVPPMFVKQLFEAIEGGTASICGLAISFGWTAQYLPNKSVTRRVWKDSHAAKFVRAYERGDRVVALNKDKRNGGEQIGWCKLTCAPYKEQLSEMPESDVAAEGGMVATVEEFVNKYFEGDRDLEVWVVRFEFLPLEEKQPAIAQRAGGRIAQQPKTCVERHPLDRYDSPHWFVTAIAPYVDLNGTIGECCVGGGVLARCLKEMGYNVWTNDINPDVDADYHHDVIRDRAWDDLPEADWIFTNPPYGDAAFKIVRNAYRHAKRGVVFLLRTTWDEPCEERAEWLFQHPITRKLTLPRYKFRENKRGKLSVEASTIAAFVWDKQIPVLPSLSIPRDRIPLFHDSANNAPSWDEIVALIKDLERPPFSDDANEACIKNSRNTIFDTRLNVRKPNVIPPSGSLMFAPAHKLKNGEDGSLRCLYRWGEKKGSVWVTRSKHVPIGKVGRVKSAIRDRQPIAEILELL